ncbi:MAG: hypothetical protein PHN82_07840 [bacterium]|nr:hypothetical protein [bacterium]
MRANAERARSAARALRPLVAASALTLAGCGTLLPGPRYMVTVDDFSFGDGGRAVVYREDRYRFYPVGLRHRDRRLVYRYDRATRRHARLAGADAFSASPNGPLVLHSPPWGRRFADPAVPDFILADSRTGARRGFFMPEGFDRGYLSYGFAFVDWRGDGSIEAWVNFRSAPGAVPSEWKRQREEPADWRTERWRVVIDPSAGGDRVAEASPVTLDEMPKVAWTDIRRRKFVSPDGRERLAFAKYDGYIRFNSSLWIEGDDGFEEHIIRQHNLIGLAQSASYIASYLAAAPFLWWNQPVEDTSRLPDTP